MQLSIIGSPIFFCSASTLYISLLSVILEQMDCLIIHHPRMILHKKMTSRIDWTGHIPFPFPCWMIPSLYLMVLLMSLDIWPLPHICICTHSTPSPSSSPPTQIQSRRSRVTSFAQGNCKGYPDWPYLWFPSISHLSSQPLWLQLLLFHQCCHLLFPSQQIFVPSWTTWSTPAGCSSQASLWTH